MHIRNEKLKIINYDIMTPTHAYSDEEALTQLREMKHHVGKDYVWTVTAPVLWHIIFKGYETLLEKLIERRLITEKHLELKPTTQSDTFYYNYPTILELMIRNHFIGLPILQRNNIISPNFLMKNLDPDQQTAYLLQLVESEDITNFCACSDAGMLQTADGLLDEEETIREYDQKTKQLYSSVVEEGVALAKKGHSLEIRALPTFFQNKLKRDIAAREEKQLNNQTPTLSI